MPLITEGVAVSEVSTCEAAHWLTRGHQAEERVMIPEIMAALDALTEYGMAKSARLAMEEAGWSVASTMVTSKQRLSVRFAGRLRRSATYRSTRSSAR